MTLVYGCCIWFSLRLGGIIIAGISLIEAIIELICLVILHKYSEDVKVDVSKWINNINLIYMRAYFEDFVEDPEKYLTLFITLACFYTIACVFYIYGAYMLKNALMYGFIILLFGRLVVFTLAIVICLLVLKQNTMDIGVLIGASVGGGFLLLGLFYLWLCAANLPLLINEMEQEDQAAMLAKLQLMLEAQNSRKFPQDSVIVAADGEYYRDGVYKIPRNARNNYLLP